MKNLLITLAAVFILAACKSTPIYNVANTNVPEGLKVEQVEKSILKALVQKSWKVKSNKDGVIKAEIQVRTHSADIEISFDATQYAINYVDSTNLKYNASKNTIHKNYNNWIIYIDRLIQTGLIDESYNK